MTKFFAIVFTMLVGVATLMVAQEKAPDELLRRIDHLVYTTPDLKTGIDTMQQLVGVQASPCGQHPGMGTRNALIALGPSTYLEIIGPDPEQPKPDGPRRFGIDDLKEPRLFTWVARGTDLDAFAAKAAQNGVSLGAVISGRRQRPDGVLLTWRYTDPNTVVADRLVPYFIDWGTSPHPALTAAPGATLVALRAEHPDATRVQKMLGALGLALAVQSGPKPALIATIAGPKGRVELRN